MSKDLHPKNFNTLVVAACVSISCLLLSNGEAEVSDKEEQLGRHMAPVPNKVSCVKYVACRSIEIENEKPALSL